jgi:hypothetical protein
LSEVRVLIGFVSIKIAHFFFFKTPALSFSICIFLTSKATLESTPKNNVGFREKKRTKYFISFEKTAPNSSSKAKIPKTTMRGPAILNISKLIGI